MSDPTRLLTPSELELMHVLWRAGHASVQEVADALGGGRAYTTVATFLKILEQKGFVTSEKAGRKLIYAPVAERARYERRSVLDLLQAVFGGDRTALVRSLLGAEPVADAELRELEQALEEARKP
jgi:predicted transcriptional regulator